MASDEGDVPFGMDLMRADLKFCTALMISDEREGEALCLAEVGVVMGAARS